MSVSKCLQDYKSTGSLIIKRLDPFSSKKDRCVKCDGLGYDYIVMTKEGLMMSSLPSEIKPYFAQLALKHVDTIPTVKAVTDERFDLREVTWNEH